MAIVTISGRVGAPSSPLGLEVANLLGADYVDHQILAEASRRSGAPLEAVVQRDERAMRVRERLGRFFQNFLEKSAAAGSAGDPFLGPSGVEVLLSRSIADATQPSSSQDQELDDERYVEIVTSVIQDVAAGGNVVIIRRGGQVILKDLPNALHVHVASSEESRIRFVQQRDGLSLEEAEKYVKETDPLRTAYYNKFFKIEPGDPTLFHLVLNVDKVGIEHSAKIIADAAKEIERQPVQG